MSSPPARPIPLAILTFVLAVCSVACGQQASVYQSGFDPYFFLIRDPFVHAELEITSQQKLLIRALTDKLDQPLLAVRGQSLAQGPETLRRLLAQARAGMQENLSSEQQGRLEEVRLRVLGIRSLLQDDVASVMQLADSQRQELARVAAHTNGEIKQLQGELKNGGDHPTLNQKLTELRSHEQQEMFELLDETQKREFVRLLGSEFDVSKIGQGIAFKAPDLSPTGQWLNSSTLDMPGLRGKVVAVHFWAFGCINCIRNYPSYLNWQEKFHHRDDFTIVGIHTPETTAEHEVDSVRRKVQEARFEFPVVIDNDKSTWNTWGNTMWPSVYLVDKSGYIRYWWYGELNWQGAGGEQFMTERIEELLAE